MIYILQKPLKDRNKKEIYIISYFISQTNLKVTGDKDQRQRMNLFFAINIYYHFLEKGQILFSEGDYADCFYILLKGRINVLKDYDYNIKLNGEEYHYLIYQIYKKNLIERAYKTIKHNKQSFFIKEKDLPLLNIHIFLTLFRRYIVIKAPQKKIQNLFIKYEVNSSEFQINFTIIDKHIQRNDYLFEILEKIIFKYFGTSSFDFDIYWYIIDEKKEDVFIFDCDIVLKLSSGEIFGDMSLDNQTNIR